MDVAENLKQKLTEERENTLLRLPNPHSIFFLDNGTRNVILQRAVAQNPDLEI